MKKVTIIGSKGFIGSNLSKYFKNLGVKVQSVNNLKNLKKNKFENIFKSKKIQIGFGISVILLGLIILLI